MANILIIEDDRTLAQTIELCLNMSVAHQCRLAHTGKEGLELFHRLAPDAVVLDLVLPDVNGLQVCTQIRELSLRQNLQPPILLMVSAKSALSDRLTGYGTGADVYFSKPFEPEELSACLRAQLHRRWQQAEFSASQLIRTPHFLINAEHKQVKQRQPCTQEWVSLSLSALEIKVLGTLASRRDRVWSRDQLIEQAWELGSEATDEAVRSCIKHLRKKLFEPDQFIKTVHGAGYKFEDFDED